ncbi:type II TA system antitoxin MqsA family protein [Pluralibacter sp.]|uniref:type II TA system antitoxin MqsA family protein n=1 Tax=Pluralibacter sp. TaxID=1920032 RepID=UPI0025D521E3|nr:type II TA system antitoxin MqsA family protein [Pluralibacter sp.]MBV8044936.1 type II toxin-antitoxin system MqsA family antitoxin [Pluralibacter sp.]
MKCPTCGQAELLSEVRDVAYSYKGQRTLIRNVDGLHCPRCGESVLDKAASEAFMAQVNAFRSTVIAQTVAPEFIEKVRKKLSLTQKEASVIFGGGVNAFSRYETGKAQPHLSTVKLLRVLDKHPELLQEIC